MIAKPKIDILVGLKMSSNIDSVVEPMIGGGYTYFELYNKSMPYRRLFAKLKPLGTKVTPRVISERMSYIDGEVFRSKVHIHVLEKDTAHWIRHIAFRDYLKSHHNVRDEYAKLKEKLATLEFRDGNDYNDHKSKFIAEVQARAVEWFTRNHLNGLGHKIN